MKNNSGLRHQFWSKNLNHSDQKKLILHPQNVLWIAHCNMIIKITSKNKSLQQTETKLFKQKDFCRTNYLSSSMQKCSSRLTVCQGSMTSKQLQENKGCSLLLAFNKRVTEFRMIMKHLICKGSWLQSIIISKQMEPYNLYLSIDTIWYNAILRLQFHIISSVEFGETPGTLQVVDKVT